MREYGKQQYIWTSKMNDPRITINSTETFSGCVLIPLAGAGAAGQTAEGGRQSAKNSLKEFDGLRRVSLGGLEWIVISLLRIPIDQNGAPDINQFAGTVELLEHYRLTAIADGRNETAPVFISYDKITAFYAALERMGDGQTWRLKKSRSTINPGDGLDVSIVLS